MTDPGDADGPARPRRIAIACQGGGSHTAFTAGVLGRWLESPELDDAEVVGLSGTSGGAICALLAWTALRDGDRSAAAARLRGYWDDNAARWPLERLANAGVLGAAVLQGLSLLPKITPYAFPPWAGAGRLFRDLLSRHVAFERVEVDAAGEHPLLLLGAVDVLSGEFRTFSSRTERITADTVLASAAIPQAFRAVHTGGGVFWDGLFSQNPPVRDLLATEPDELWVVQINPSRTPSEPRTVTEIEDRRNELAGNLSLYQELGFVETIDGLLDAGHLGPDSGYRQIRIRVLEMPRGGLARELLGAASKLNRDWSFLRGLLDEGAAQAELFLISWRFERAWRARDQGALLAAFASGAEIVSADPFPPVTGDLPGFLTTLRDAAVAVDATRKQVAGDVVTWRVLVRDAGSGEPRPGTAELTFREGLVVRLELAPLP